MQDVQVPRKTGSPLLWIYHGDFKLPLAYRKEPVRNAGAFKMEATWDAACLLNETGTGIIGRLLQK